MTETCNGRDALLDSCLGGPSRLESANSSMLLVKTLDPMPTFSQPTSIRAVYRLVIDNQRSISRANRSLDLSRRSSLGRRSVSDTPGGSSTMEAGSLTPADGLVESR